MGGGGGGGGVSGGSDSDGARFGGGSRTGGAAPTPVQKLTQPAEPVSAPRRTKVSRVGQKRSAASQPSDRRWRRWNSGSHPAQGSGLMECQPSEADGVTAARAEECT